MFFSFYLPRHVDRRKCCQPSSTVLVDTYTRTNTNHATSVAIGRMLLCIRCGLEVIDYTLGLRDLRAFMFSVNDRWTIFPSRRQVSLDYGRRCGTLQFRFFHLRPNIKQRCRVRNAARMRCKLQIMTV